MLPIFTPAADVPAQLTIVESKRLAWSGSLPQLVERIGPEFEAHGAKLHSVSDTRAKYRLTLADERASLILKYDPASATLTFRAMAAGGQDAAWLQIRACKKALVRAVATPEPLTTLPVASVTTETQPGANQ
jgi:hypothetical protein